MNDMHPELIVAVLNGEATPEEIELLREWRVLRDENEAEFQRLARLWEVAGDLDQRPHRRSAPSAERVAEIVRLRSEAENIEAESAAGPGRAKTAHSSGTARPRSPKSGAGRRGRRASFYRVAALAASLVVGLGLGTFASEWGAEEPFGPTATVTGPGQVSTTTLGDGTVVQLAPNSRLEFSRGGSVREVSLEGRAYFAVPSYDDRNFQVRLPGGEIEVLGTRFDVEGRGGEIRVAVVEGEVRMATERGEVSATARQLARSVETGPPEVEDVEDVYEVISWLGGFLAFQSTPLVEVAEELERRIGLTIEIEDSALLDRMVTGWFADQTPGEMIAGICRAVNAQCEVEDDQTVRMSRSSGNGFLN